MGSCVHYILYIGLGPSQGTSLEVPPSPYLPSSHAAPLLLIHSRSHPPSHHRFITPSPCPLPSIIHPSSLLPCLPPCLPASRRPIQCTQCVCVWQAALYCVALAMRDTGTMVRSRQQQVSFQWPAVTLSERAPTTNPFLTKSKKIGRSTCTTNTTQTRSTLVPFRGCRRRLSEPSTMGANSVQR